MKRRKISDRKKGKMEQRVREGIGEKRGMREERWELRKGKDEDNYREKGEKLGRGKASGSERK